MVRLPVIKQICTFLNNKSDNYKNFEWVLCDLKRDYK